MYDVLNRYLVQHKSISIPGLGSLVAEHVPAATDFANKRLLPPQLKYRFNKYFDSPDRDFFQYLSAQKKIEDFEAIKEYNDFAYELRNKIRTQNEALWDGVGVFKKDNNGDIVFELLKEAAVLYAPVAAERIIRHDAKHSIRVGDTEKTNEEMTELLSDHTYVEKEQWWIYALILGAIGLIILFFHFYGDGFKWGSGGNTNKVVPAITNTITQ
jgi:hypothetical protein